MKQTLPVLILLASAVAHFLVRRSFFDTALITALGVGPLAFIYFGKLVGAQVRGTITEPTPGRLVVVFGWASLVCLCLCLFAGMPFTLGRF